MRATLAEREAALEQAVTRIHALAGDMGHSLHTPWRFNDDLSASTACMGCGMTAAVRVYGDGRVWQAGGLTYERPCTAGPMVAQTRR